MYVLPCAPSKLVLSIMLPNFVFLGQEFIIAFT
jgi:hypothetical protein